MLAICKVGVGQRTRRRMSQPCAGPAHVVPYVPVLILGSSESGTIIRLPLYITISRYFSLPFSALFISAERSILYATTHNNQKCHRNPTQNSEQKSKTTVAAVDYPSETSQNINYDPNLSPLRLKNAKINCRHLENVQKIMDYWLYFVVGVYWKKWMRAWQRIIPMKNLRNIWRNIVLTYWRNRRSRNMLLWVDG